MKLTSRREFIKAGLTGAAATISSSNVFAQSKGKYNVLFIAVDDLRPQMGCYGQKQMHTPNLDRLAEKGIVFNRAYCQQAVCSPSRTSLLTGLRPDSTKIYDLQTHFRLTIPNVVTLPQYFKKNGYHTQALGKIYHGGLNDSHSWSVRHWQPTGPSYCDPGIIQEMNRELEEIMAKNKGPAVEILKKDPQTSQPLKVSRPKFRVRGPSWESANAPDNALPDGQTAEKAIELLQSVKDQRFFLAVGFLKPHLPFVAPKKYYDLYPSDKITVADNIFAPKDAPKQALHNYGELRNYNDIPKEGPLTQNKTKELTRAYYASTSYVDAQIGRVIDELDKLGLRENTVIVLWGDHGWQLGEHALWCKHSNFETSTHSPLIINTPDMPETNVKTEGLTEFVDIYPTLCDLCDLPVPEGLEGVSLAPLIKSPDRPWKEAAFSQYPRGKNIMGYSMRTDHFRYTEWIKTDEDKTIAVELYDHTADPKENVNVAAKPEYKEIAQSLSCKLHKGWQAAKPQG
jgi:iduronate 2-sulfatase